jgi:arachidonate 15-lipoxygenase
MTDYETKEVQIPVSPQVTPPHKSKKSILWVPWTIALCFSAATLAIVIYLLVHGTSTNIYQTITSPVNTCLSNETVHTHNISSDITLKLPQKEDNATRQLRQYEVGFNRKIYTSTTRFNRSWVKTSGLLGSQTLINVQYFLTFLTSKDNVIATNYIKQLQTQNIQLNSLDSYETLYNIFGIGVPLGFHGWKTDEAFAEIFVTVAPFLITQTYTLPFSLNESIWSNLGYSNRSLQFALANKQIYVVDLTVPVKVQNAIRSGLYFQSSISLYYETDAGKLMPVAILVLNYDNVTSQYTPGLICTPLNDKWDWLLAKIIVRNVAHQYHNVWHVSLIHVVIESFFISTQRNLNAYHPLFNLLSKILTNADIFTYITENYLINPGGYFDFLSIGGAGFTEWILHFLDNYNWNSQKLHTDIQNRNMNNIKYFPFRDDAYTITHLETTFLSSYIEIYYETDTDVINDYELQAWVLEISKTTPGVLDSLQTKSQLIDLVSQLLYLTSIAHHGINTKTVWNYEILPASGGLISKPMPTTYGTLNETILLTYLPDAYATLKIFLFYNSFSLGINRNEVLTNVLNNINLGSQEQVRPIIDNFVAGCHNLSENISKREENNIRPYTFLDPSQLPISTWI